METEYYVLNADSHNDLPCTVLLFLSLGLRLFPGELAFKHTSQLDNHNATCFGVQLLGLV